MNSQNTDRESHRVKELAAEYRNKGYAVTEPRQGLDTPAFLRSVGYVPDLIARSKSGNLVIEVKSRQTARDLSHLSQVAERVNAQPGWQFVLVFTNPRELSGTAGQPSVEKVEELLKKSRSFGHQKPAHVEAAFLFAWSALEVAARLLPVPRKATRAISTPWTLIRDAAIVGLIGRDEARVLERLFRLRNSILHAGEEPAPDDTDLATLIGMAEDLLRQAQEHKG